MRTSLAEPLQVTEAERRPTRRWGLALSVHWQGPWAGGEEEIEMSILGISI